MGKVIRSNLKDVLETHGIKAIALFRAVQKRYGDKAIGQATVYAVARGNGLPDERTAEQVLHALMDITGRKFGLGELFEWEPDGLLEQHGITVQERGL